MINAHTADLPKMHICELHEGVVHETQWLRSSPAQYAAPRKSLCGTVLQQSTDQRATSWESRAQCGGDRLSRRGWKVLAGSRGDMTEDDKSRQEEPFVAMFVVLRAWLTRRRSVLRVRSLDTVAASLLVRAWRVRPINGRQIGKVLRNETDRLAIAAPSRCSRLPQKGFAMVTVPRSALQVVALLVTFAL